MQIKFQCRNYDKKIREEVGHLGGYETTCENGHKIFLFFQGELYELLYDLGCKAFIDAYYREAVFNFYAALEQFSVCLMSMNHTLN
jgi:hypothetical protein